MKHKKTFNPKPYFIAAIIMITVAVCGFAVTNSLEHKSATQHKTSKSSSVKTSSSSSISSSSSQQEPSSSSSQTVQSNADNSQVASQEQQAAQQPTTSDSSMTLGEYLKTHTETPTVTKIKAGMSPKDALNDTYATTLNLMSSGEIQKMHQLDGD